MLALEEEAVSMITCFLVFGAIEILMLLLIFDLDSIRHDGLVRQPSLWVENWKQIGVSEL